MVTTLIGHEDFSKSFLNLRFRLRSSIPANRPLCMFKDHQGGEAVRTSIDTERLAVRTKNGEGAVDRVSCSASVLGNKLTVTIANSHYTDDTELKLCLPADRKYRLNRKVLLEASDPHMFNSFDEPVNIVPVSMNDSYTANQFDISLPPASVMLLSIDI